MFTTKIFHQMENVPNSYSVILLIADKYKSFEKMQ